MRAGCYLLLINDGPACPRCAKSDRHGDRSARDYLIGFAERRRRDRPCATAVRKVSAKYRKIISVNKSASVVSAVYTICIYVYYVYTRSFPRETAPAATASRLFAAAAGCSLGNNVVHLGGGGLMMRVIVKFQKRKRRAAAAEPSPQHPSGDYVPDAGRDASSDRPADPPRFLTTARCPASRYTGHRVILGETRGQLCLVRLQCVCVSLSYTLCTHVAWLRGVLNTAFVAKKKKKLSALRVG